MTNCYSKRPCCVKSCSTNCCPKPKCVQGWCKTDCSCACPSPCIQYCCNYTPQICNLCHLLKRYEDVTKTTYQINCSCSSVCVPGVFLYNFGIIKAYWSYQDKCEKVCGEFDVCELNSLFEKKYVSCNRINCCDLSPFNTCQSIRVPNCSKVNIVFIIWYIVCDCLRFDIYRGSVCSLQCNPCNPCVDNAIELCYVKTIKEDKCSCDYSYLDCYAKKYL